MSFSAQGVVARSRVCLAACLWLVVGLVGCGTGQQSASEALERQFKDNPQLKKANIARFAGKVTVDGQPPAQDHRLFVILNDPQHLDENAHLKTPKLYVICDKEGTFAFGTYDRADGVPAGKYVVTFVELHAPGRTGIRGASAITRPKFLGPDALNNLYNDPDKNRNEPNFSLDLQPPGKADYHFDLAVAGKDPVTTPGPNAMTEMRAP